MDDYMEEETDGENVDSDSQDLSRGYCIKVHVRDDGSFHVVGPIKYAKEEKEEHEDSLAQVAESLPDALKLILQTVRENPVGENAQADLDAGFLAGPAGKMSRAHYM